jgi:hypothetical protein
MARLNPNRRLLVTTFNTALATAAVTATAAGWVAFGMSDTGSAAASAQSDLPASQFAPSSQQQPPTSQQQPFSFGRHRGHHDGLGFGSDGGAGQSQPSFGGSSGSSGQSQPSLGGSQFRRPLTSTRSSR